MTRWTLCAAIAAAIAAAPAGAAVTLDPNGAGQGLLFPYFSTHNGQSTMINVHNGSADGKALKVRILESHAGAVTLAYNLYLAPGATWKAALVQQDPAAGAFATLREAHTTCASPMMPEDGWDLLPYDFHDDGGPQTGERSREGFVEIIELGTLSDALSDLAASVDCDEFVERHTSGGIWRTNPNADLSAPSGGLRGTAVLIDSADGTSFDYPALAFDGLASAARQQSNSVNDGNDAISPALTDVQPAAGEDHVDAYLPGAGADGSSVTLRYDVDEGYNAISALLANRSARNGFSLNPGMRARTEWIYSFPTLRAHRATSIVGTPPPNHLNAPPFAANLSRCETVAFTVSDHLGVAAGEAQDVLLCGSAGVVRFAADGLDTAPIVALDDDPVLQPGISAGAMTAHFDEFDDDVRASVADAEGLCFTGLPVWAMAVSAYDNDNAQEGRIATFPVDEVAGGGTQIIDCSSD